MKAIYPQNNIKKERKLLIEKEKKKLKRKIHLIKTEKNQNRFAIDPDRERFKHFFKNIESEQKSPEQDLENWEIFARKKTTLLLYSMPFAAVRRSAQLKCIIAALPLMSGNCQWSSLKAQSLLWSRGNHFYDDCTARQYDSRNSNS